MHTLLKGTTIDCLAHLREAIKDDYQGARRIMAAFLGVSDLTIRRWFKGDMEPIGEQLVRLRVYMQLLGYTVTEFDALPGPIQGAAKLFAFRVLDLMDISRGVGYETPSSSSLLAIFRGTRGVSREKLSQFRDLAEMYSDEIDRSAAAVIRVSLRVPDGSSANKISAQKTTRGETKKRESISIPPIGRRRATDSHDAMLQSLANQVKAMIPLAEIVSSDEFTSGDRARLRDLSGVDGIFVLANLLYRLCGERGRTHNLAQGGI